MIRPPLIVALLLSALVSGCVVHPEGTPQHLQNARVLPLALNGTFSIRKQELFLDDPRFDKPTVNPMIVFERQRMNYGAVSAEEQRARFGNYFSFWWRATKKANLTARLEYRQQNLGDYVQAQEIPVPGAFGTFEVKFQVSGDDYNLNGRVTAWRAVLIENGKIVALTQSFLWH